MNPLHQMKWPLYSDHLRDMLHQIMDSKIFTDVTLISDDQLPFRAHRNILAACSTVMNSMLQFGGPTPNPIIYLRGINHRELESLLQFIYEGQVTLSQNRVQEFLSIAKGLNIKGLLDNSYKGDVEILDTEVNKKTLEHLSITKFECDQCEYQSGNERDIQKHVQIHVSLNESLPGPNNPLLLTPKNENKILANSNYKCIQCDFQGQEKLDVDAHIDYCHTQVKTETNTAIELEKLKKFQKFEIHREKEIQKKSLYCKICKYHAPTNQRMRLHYETRKHHVLKQELH